VEVHLPASGLSNFFVSFIVLLSSAVLFHLLNNRMDLIFWAFFAFFARHFSLPHSSSFLVGIDMRPFSSCARPERLNF
jgi:hypothetical protein